ncbi:MAG: DNA polymerase III subunit gamma/tau [Syntrophomonadaceae bacterium]|nr:DNA polymerase III subunit gamma/tau [Syntrophomonadaceae bacterium]
MAYLALYRAWRPQKFDEVVGQESTVTALQNALNEGKLTHAYLFTGPRGTGKTSIAKIVAKAVNCENLEAGEPCNKCSSCHDINNGNFMDVIEIDAASNRSVDEMRDLREKVRILPAQGKEKVYIIDEVHMLTPEAFNTLLKTLEEPPARVKFILATTEAHKIPATIRSRCQIYNFRRLTGNEIVSRLKQVASTDRVEVTDDALKLIARRANGGLRDALSMLDQIYSYKGEKITKKDVLDVLGIVDDLFLAQLMEQVFAADTGKVINMLGEILNSGKEAQQLAREASLYLRDLMLYIILGDEAEFSVITEESMPYIKQQAKIKEENIFEALKIMMETGDKLKFSDGNKYLLEISLLDIAAIKYPKAEKLKASEPAIMQISKPEQLPKLNKDETREVMWNKILQGVKEQKVPTHALLCQAKLLGTKENVMFIGFKKGYKFHKERMEEKANRDIVEKVVKELLNKEMQLQFIFLDEDKYNDIVAKKAIEYFGEDIVEIKD